MRYEKTTSRCPRSLRSALATALSALALGAVFAPPATAAPDIEGVWSFTGGAVGVQALGDGSLQGTVLSPTTFASCEHPVGQVMWTSMTPQPDGSYWGKHQWYIGDCVLDPVLGLTAWRVLTRADGSRVLKVCFSNPGDASQPQIAADGTATGATYKCSESAALGPLPGSQASFGSFVSTPGAGPCVSRRSLKIFLRKPKYDPLRELIVRVRGKKVADLEGKSLGRRSLRLTGLPEGTFKLKIVALTVLGKRYQGVRTYHACAPGPGTVRAPGPKHGGS